MSNENWNEESTRTQVENIRAYLLEGKSITPLEALNMFGCFRLAAVIFTLREEGLPIVTEKFQVSPKKRVAKYYIEQGYQKELWEK